MTDEPFASATVAEHVLRGVVGLVLVVAAFALAPQHPAALLLVLPGGLAWRGCPTCWTLGLVQTLRRRQSSCRSC